MACFDGMNDGLLELWKGIVDLIEAAKIDPQIEDELLNGNTDALFETVGCPVPDKWTIDVDPCYARLVITPNDTGDGVIVMVPYNPRGADGNIQPSAATRTDMDAAGSPAEALGVYLADSDVRSRLQESGAAECSYGCHNTTAEPLRATKFNRIPGSPCGGSSSDGSTGDTNQTIVTTGKGYPKGRLTFEWE